MESAAGGGGRPSIWRRTSTRININTRDRGQVGKQKYFLAFEKALDSFDTVKYVTEQFLFWTVATLYMHGI